MKLRLCFLTAISVAAAHSMGNFSVSHYTRLEVSAKGVEVTYVLDLAEVPAFRMLREWNVDPKSPQSLLDQKAARQAQEWARNLEFRATGEAIQPRFVSASIRMGEGADGQPVARVTSNFELDGVTSPLQFEDRNFPDRAGWKEIVVAPGAGAQIVRASQGSQDRSKMLTEYPPDAANSAPQDLRASVDWRSGGSGQAAQIVPIEQPAPVVAPPSSASAPPSQVAAQKSDFLSRLLANREIGWPWLLLGLLVAFGVGGAHALEPGHGKTLVAAYLVGSRGTMKHAALLGAVVTFTHTISVFLLGLAMLLLAKSVVPDTVIKVLEEISGLSIVAIGAVLLVQRLRRLSVASSADHHHHHDHPHQHAHAHQHGHAHHNGHGHEHGPHTHTHLPEGEITPAGLIALGVSGGLVPCPAALVIMLAAIAFGHTGAGLILLVAFSLGLAGVLIGVGWLVLYAKRWLPDSSAASHSRFVRLVPVFSAIIIVCIGLVMTGVSLGWLRPGLAV